MLRSFNHILRTACTLAFTLIVSVSYAAVEGDTLVVEADSILLRELTVTGALHPIVQRGDTLIYDVSAFPLPDGSRLRELPYRLPGVDVTADGIIRAQGVEVSCLLLNGRDFFSGNRSVVLDNLPAEVLLEIQIY